MLPCNWIFFFVLLINVFFLSFFPHQFLEFYVKSSSLCLYIKESTGFLRAVNFLCTVFLTVVDCTKKAFTPSPIRTVKNAMKGFCHYQAHFFEFWHTFLNFHMKQELSKLKTSKFPEKNWNHLNYCQIKEYFCPIFQKQLRHIAMKNYLDFLLNTCYITKTFVSTRILKRCLLSFLGIQKLFWWYLFLNIFIFCWILPWKSTRSGIRTPFPFHFPLFYFLHILSASCTLSHFLPNILVIHMSRHCK